MRKFAGFLLLTITLSAFALGRFMPAHAQTTAPTSNVVSYTTLMFTPSASPVSAACSKTVGCAAYLKLCQSGANLSGLPAAEQKTCVFLAGASVNNWVNVSVEELTTVKDSTGAVISSSDAEYPLGTVRVALTPQSTNSTP